MAKRGKRARKIQPPAGELPRWQVWAVYLAPAALALAIFAFSLKNGWVWDDRQYLLENPFLKLKWPAFIKWAFTSFYAANYHPITWLSHRLDAAVWGGAPLGHHLTSVVLHAANTLLVVHLGVILTRLASKDASRKLCLYAGLFAGLLFGLHPLRVESVAWVAERKDLLCALFFLLAVIWHIRFAESGQSKWYRLSIGAGLVALLAKPMAVSLPIVLLILDVYPLGRLNVRDAFGSARRVLMEKAPLVLMVAASCLLTLFAQKAAGATVAVQHAPFMLRLWVAAKGLVFYLVKTVAPIGLAPLYPYPEGPGIEHYGAAALVLAFAVFVTVKRRELPWLWAASLYYLITLVPVLGLVQVGQQSAADRYTYLPMLAFVFVAAAGWARIMTSSRPGLGRVAAVGLGCFTLLMGFLTFRQIPFWQDEVSLFTREIAIFGERAPSAYNNRGAAYERLGRFRDALGDYEAALKFRPDYPDALVNRARLRRLMHDNEAALADLDRAAALAPNHLKVYNSRGVLLDIMGRHEEARRDLEKGLALNPYDRQARFNTALHHLNFGDLKEAEAHARKAVALGPGFPKAHELLATVLMRRGKLKGAEQSFQDALSLDPGSSSAGLTLARLLTRQDRAKDAIGVLDGLLALNPGLGEGFFMRGVLRLRLGQRGPGEADMRRAASLGHPQAAAFLKKIGR